MSSKKVKGNSKRSPSHRGKRFREVIHMSSNGGRNRNQPHMRSPITAQRFVRFLTIPCFSSIRYHCYEYQHVQQCYSQASNAQRLSARIAFNFIHFTTRNRWFVGRLGFSPMHTMVHCRAPHAWTQLYSTLVLVPFDKHHQLLTYSGDCFCFEA